jgi:hypothetical protein
MSTKKTNGKPKGKHGRIKGKVYPDLLRRSVIRVGKLAAGLVKTAESYNKQAKQYDHKALPADLEKAIASASGALNTASVLVKKIASNAD